MRVSLDRWGMVVNVDAPLGRRLLTAYLAQSIAIARAWAWPL